MQGKHRPYGEQDLVMTHFPGIVCNQSPCDGEGLLKHLDIQNSVLKVSVSLSFTLDPVMIGWLHSVKRVR